MLVKINQKYHNMLDFLWNSMNFIEISKKKENLLALYSQISSSSAWKKTLKSFKQVFLFEMSIKFFKFQRNSSFLEWFWPAFGGVAPERWLKYTTGRGQDNATLIFLIEYSKLNLLLQQFASLFYFILNGLSFLTLLTKIFWVWALKMYLCHQFLQYFILYQLWIVDLKHVSEL